MSPTDTANRVAERLEPARERMSEVAEAVEPTARRVGSTVAGGARTVIASLAFLPGILSSVLGVLSSLSGTLAERGREVAHRVEPPASERRRSRLRTVLWFLGGFGAGTATGWVLHARMQEAPAPATPSTVGTSDPLRPNGVPSSPIDARRENIDLR